MKCLSFKRTAEKLNAVKLRGNMIAVHNFNIRSSRDRGLKLTGRSGTRTHTDRADIDEFSF